MWRFQARRVYLDFPLEAGEGEGGATCCGLRPTGQQDATTPVLSLFPKFIPDCACHTRQLIVIALHRLHQPTTHFLYRRHNTTDYFQANLVHFLLLHISLDATTLHPIPQGKRSGS
ncbi:hypothetical protein I312_101754 [Cryptococcus bacillisporus CA1280]|uniref:uncharacterized protein n=1 Tax=Cryptococcus bacillisporus CA1280 TaxID=1296109 RepID=UPI003366A469